MNPWRSPATKTIYAVDGLLITRSCGTDRKAKEMLLSSRSTDQPFLPQAYTTGIELTSSYDS